MGAILSKYDIRKLISRIKELEKEISELRIQLDWYKARQEDKSKVE